GSVDARFQQNHKGRRVRPGEAGLSRRRTDAGADASGARARTEGNKLQAPTPMKVRGLRPRTLRAKRRTSIAAKAQLSPRGYAASLQSSPTPISTARGGSS